MTPSYNAWNLTSSILTTVVGAFELAYRSNRFTTRRILPPGHGSVEAANDAVARPSGNTIL